MRTLLISFALTLTACGAAQSNNSGTCSTQSGTTDCRGVTCQAGNYCSNNYYVSDYCQPGCTSDSNCGPGDHCARCPGESIGVCQACGTAASCGAGSHCTASNQASSECSSEGKGSDGYECTDSDKPVGQCTQSTVNPSMYCCGTVQSSCSATPSSNQCNGAFVQFMGAPGDYTHPYSCSGAATPAGTCKHLNADVWCCN